MRLLANARQGGRRGIDPGPVALVGHRRCALLRASITLMPMSSSGSSRKLAVADG